MRRIVIVMGVATLAAYFVLTPRTVSGTARVVDGDTIAIGGERIRLHGIDAPEMSQMCGAQPCGLHAAEFLQDLIAKRKVICTPKFRDNHNRLVATCYADRDELGEILVLNGHAVAYRRYSSDYERQETMARLAGFGIWSGPFVAPEQWRRAHQ